ncbi:transcriptional regulator [Burkholderia cenocepacia]|uniref:transcriptional regulator n=1 Tax=Burkholderia cenocepacia TaxID=95486 RepID=UPI0013F13D2D|nr:transcriptional regulator [Burkholderia cenocepacia]MCW3581759.1 transcriptional regulator [Burkholderia cenocepacia]MCW3626667.1 transcriptional regulator [Burkholderia cenocepacia]MCW3641965.1 transcriptional regulator [Burkholderia cenocepacia]MCW5179754.1 transcriptional regulator [Burkholderia cenocepacia]NGO94401.1 hypothetical protein [Burkholderia cenocepacia]
MPNDNVLTDEARATIMDACQSISRSADALKESNTALDGTWCDADEKAAYEVEVRLIERLRALLAAHPGQPEPRVADAIPRVHGVSRFADNPCTVLVMLMSEATDDALRAIHDRLACQPESRAEVTEEQPSLTNPLTPYGLLCRALRIIAGTLLGDMARHLGCSSAMLSAVEFGRRPLTDAMVADAAAYFSSCGIPDTLHALNAARAGGQHADQA